MKSLKLNLFLAAAVLGLMAAGCSNEKHSAPTPPTAPAAAKTETPATPAAPAAPAVAPAAPAPANNNEVAVITTSEGVMVLEFYPDVAPKHVENFKTLAKKGFYDGTCFHRVIKGFMIQGGDPNTKDDNAKDSWGAGGPGYTINAEFNAKHHKRGILSMARTSDPNSAGSQFFICHGEPGFLDNQYTVFGNLIKGDDVLEKIGTTPTEGSDRPVKRMNIESIKIVPADSVK
jgi:peptidyl-prolyl cis-trans isomerase B (cyclophilin B)